MGLFWKLFFVFVSVFLAYSYQTYRRHMTPLDVPALDMKRYWGPGQPKPDSTKIEKFVIDFKPEVSVFVGICKQDIDMIRVDR